MINWYRKNVFPYLLKKVLDRPSIMKLRVEALQTAQGNILEIGFGLGLNLPCYPQSIENIVALDWKNCESEQTKIKVDFMQASAENTGFQENTFDTIVSTFNLCSMPKNVLEEALRILKKGGKLLFLEHGLAEKKQYHIFQHILTPFSKILGCGCHLNKNHFKNIEEAGFKITFYRMEKIPSCFGFALGHFYIGIGEK